MDKFRDFPGLSGLFIAGIFSAALSSLSTGLNSLSAVILEDYIKPYVREPLSERTVNYIMRSIVLITGFSCIALVFIVEQLGAVLQMSMSISGITNGPLFAIFIIGLLIPWINAKSAFCGGICGLLFVAYVSFKSQAAIAAGEFYYRSKKMSIEGCWYDFDRSILNVTFGPDISEVEEKSLYHISYLWYILFGSLVTIFMSFAFSFVFGFQKIDELDITVIAPFLRKYFNGKQVTAEIMEQELTCYTHKFKTDTE